MPGGAPGAPAGYVAASDLVPEVNREEGTAVALTVFGGALLRDRAAALGGRDLVSDAPARVHRRPPALGAPAVGALPALRPVEGIRTRGAGRGDRLSRRRRGERPPPPRRLPPALRAPRRVVRAGEERAREPGLRLRHAAHRALGLDDPRAAGPEPDAAPVPRAIPSHEGVARLARGPDLPLHQQEERAVHARRRGLALGPPRVPPRPDRLTDPRPCLGSERKRACGVGGSCEGRAAAGEAGAAKLTPWESASLRRGPVLSGDALPLQQVCRAGFCRPRHAVGPVDRAARSLSVPGPRQGLGPTEVAARVRAGGDDAEALRARVGECRLREARRDLAPAQRGRREGVLQVEQIAAPFVDERRLRAVQSHDEAPRLVLDAHLHRPTLPAERTRGKTAQGGPRAIN